MGTEGECACYAWEQVTTKQLFTEVEVDSGECLPSRDEAR